MKHDSNPLKTHLLDLLHELHGQDVPLILGGGYGLYLKQLHLQDDGKTPTLIKGELWPVPRATEDLDILLRTEIVVDAQRMRPIRAALDQLNYTAISGAEYMQFAKDLGGGQSVKIDFLTGPLGSLINDPRVKIDDRRVRPRPSVKLHAHRIDEAIGFQDNTSVIQIQGTRSSGDTYQAEIHVPSPLTLLLMKLHAFRDRFEDEKKDLARHHALDIYRIIAMMTEPEFTSTQEQIAVDKEQPVLTESSRIVSEFFSTPESMGCLRLRDHSLWNEQMALGEFLSALNDLFRPE